MDVLPRTFRLRGLEVPEVVVEKKSQISESEYRPPQITEMFAVTASTLPLFKDMGYTYVPFKWLGISLPAKSVLSFPYLCYYLCESFLLVAFRSFISTFFKF